MLGLILDDSKPVGCPWERGEYTAHLDILKLRQDAIRTAVAAIVNEVVSVPPSSAGSHLDKPGPDVMRRATNCDRVIDRAYGLGYQAVSGKSPSLLARSRADLHAAVSRKSREYYQYSGERNQYLSFHGHMPERVLDKLRTRSAPTANTTAASPVHGMVMQPGESVSMLDGHPRILKAIHHMWPWDEATVVTAV